MNVEEIFLRAQEKKTPAERAAYLEGACGKDVEKRQRVESLLASHDQAGSFLEQPLFECDATQASAIAEQSGTRIGAYKLLQQIGEGGFGVVFMAEQQTPVVRKVALKIIKPGMDSKEVVARFEAERQALAMMDHPNIARVFDGGTTESGRPYFVMELVRGVPITEYSDHNDLTPNERLQLFVAVCHAVQHAHHKGVIHRDIKPSNVLVTLHDGEPLVKVIDFGVAKAIHHRLTDKTLFTNFLQMIGTPLYMSPEQAELSQYDVDTRTDVYSLGVLLYELLVGITPFDKDRLQKAAYDEMRRIIREEEPLRPSSRLSTLGATLTAVCSHRRTEPRVLSKLVRGDLDWIVMKALEKDRNRRYDTAKELASDIQRHLSHTPVHAGPPSMWYRLEKFARRNRAAVATGFVVAVALVSGVMMMAWGYSQAQRQKNEAIVSRNKEAAARQQATALAEKAQKEAENAALALQVVGTALGVQSSVSGPTQTVAELLDTLSEMLDSNKVPNSYVEANIRMMLAEGYWRAEKNDLARRQWEKALPLQRLVHGGNSRQVAQTLIKIAMTHHVAGQGAEGEKFARESLEVFRQIPGGAKSHDFASALNDLSACLLRQGKPAEGLTVAQEALALTRKLSGNDEDLPGWILYHIAECHAAMGNLEEAIITLRQATKGFKNARDIGGQWQSLMTAGNLLRQAKKLDAAREAFQEAAEIAESIEFTGPRKRGDAMVSLVQTLTDLSAELRKQAKLDEATSMEQEASTALATLKADDNPQPGWTLCQLGECYLALNDVEQAIAEFQKAEADFSRVGDAAGRHHAMMRTGDVLLTYGKPDEAMAAFRKAAEAAGVIESVGPEKRRETLTSIGQLQMCLEDHLGAEQTFREILRELPEADNKDASSLPVARYFLVWVEMELGKHSEAESEASHLRAAIEPVIASDHPLFSPFVDRILLAELLVYPSCKEDNFNRAAELMQAAREITPEPDTFFLQWMEAVDGRIAELQGDMTRALACSRSALSRNKVADRLSYAFCRRRLIRLLRAEGKMDELEQVLRQGVEDHVQCDGEEGILTAYARVLLAEFLTESKRLDEAEPLLKAASSRIMNCNIIPDTKKQAVQAMLAAISGASKVAPSSSD